VASTNSGGSSGAQALVLAVALFCLAGTLMISQLLRLAHALEPKVGDIISFEQARGLATLAPDRILVARAGAPPTARCALDTGVMQGSGGSIVIEALLPGPASLYRVHWAGFHTSFGDADCGAGADLLLSRSQVNKLLSAAGGQAIAGQGLHSEYVLGAGMS
jgi:hypothetical protein